MPLRSSVRTSNAQRHRVHGASLRTAPPLRALRSRQRPVVSRLATFGKLTRDPRLKPPARTAILSSGKTVQRGSTGWLKIKNADGPAMIRVGSDWRLERTARRIFVQESLVNRRGIDRTSRRIKTISDFCVGRGRKTKKPRRRRAGASRWWATLTLRVASPAAGI